MRSLDVYRYGDLAGWLRDRQGLIEFEYADPLINRDLRAISGSLPMEPLVHRGPIVSNFIGNLIPEGMARDRFARARQLDASDDFGLLQLLPDDLAGGLSFCTPGQAPRGAARFADSFDLIKPAELGEFIAQLADEDPAASSTLGAAHLPARASQEVGVGAFGDGDIYWPRAGASSTHHLRFAGLLGADAELAPGSVYNEYFCTLLAQACGLQTREVELHPIDLRGQKGHYALLCKRDDRQIAHRTAYGAPEHTVSRIHLEDFCQALGRHRSAKYEAQDGVALASMFAFIGDSTRTGIPVMDKMTLLQQVLFNLVIGNREAHAKTFQLRRSGERAALAPMTRLICTEIYPQLSVDASSRLPQRFGGAECFEDIDLAALQRFADFDASIPKNALPRLVSAYAFDVKGKIDRVLKSISREPFAPVCLPVALQAAEQIRTNIDSLQQRLRKVSVAG